jgi:hypothetical protein
VMKQGWLRDLLYEIFIWEKPISHFLIYYDKIVSV